MSPRAQVSTALPLESFGKWEEAKFAPEADVIDAMGKIEGVSQVETQTMTFMAM